MKDLHGEVVSVSELTEEQKHQMFQLMDTYYENMMRENFDRDLARKHYCILLTDSEGVVRGFSTQQLLNFPAGGRTVHGVFSGDTIIHRECWGGHRLFQEFARFFFAYGERYDHFYWFLISKGYKTYRMLPTFFREFYPARLWDTPEEIREIMDCFGAYLYPEDYDQASGVVVYRHTKDTLRQGVADITESRRKDPDIRFFEERNPDYQKGNDIVCLAELCPKNLKKGMEGRLL